MAIAPLWIGAFVHAVLAFPTGRPAADAEAEVGSEIAETLFTFAGRRVRLIVRPRGLFGAAAVSAAAGRLPARRSVHRRARTQPRDKAVRTAPVDPVADTSQLTTWAWTLDPTPDGSTRLITRVRSRPSWRHPSTLAWLLLFEVADFPLMRKCLLGIKQRAESPVPGARPAS